MIKYIRNSIIILMSQNTKEQTPILNAETRSSFNKYQSKIDRENEKIPCVVYTKDKKNIYCLINKKDLNNWYHKSFAEYQKLIITIDNKEILVFPKRIDTNKVSEEILHCEFIKLEKGEKYILEIPILYDKVSISEGKKNKGVFVTPKKTIKLLCHTESIPNMIIFDGSKVKINDKIKASDLELPKNVTLKEDDTIIATCLGSRVKEEKSETTEETADKK